MSSLSITAPRFEECNLEAEMRSLPLDVQADALNDLYGRRAAINENVGSITIALQRLSQEIDSIPDKDAFLQALDQNPEYAQNHDFWLMFLRAELFDISKAAQRIMKYWEEKVKLFGPRKAFHPLTIHDLEPKDVEVLLAGGVRMLPGKDASRRGILCTDRTKWSRDRPSMIRVLWYVTHLLLEDSDVQKNGLVLIEGNRKDFNLHHFDRMLNNKMLQHSRFILPIRICSCHLLITSSIVELVLPFMLFAMGKDLRARLCIHTQSSRLGFFPELESFGITATQIPREVGGNLNCNNLDSRWLSRQVSKDSDLTVSLRSRTPPRKNLTCSKEMARAA